MSALLEQVCASGGPEVVIDTLELSCAAWDEPIRLVQGYFDEILGLENGQMVTFKAAPMTIVLPKRNNSPSQTLTFAIDNVTGEAQRRLDQALEAEARVTITFRRYLDVDRTGPSERAFVSTVQGGAMKSRTVQLNAGFMNLLDWKYPRQVYDLNFAPQLAYL